MGDFAWFRKEVSMRQDVNSLVAALQEVRPILPAGREKVDRPSSKPRRHSEKIDRSSQQAELTGVKTQIPQRKISAPSGYVRQPEEPAEWVANGNLARVAKGKDSGFARQRSQEEQAERAEIMAAAIMEEEEAQTISRRRRKGSKQSVDSTDTSEHDFNTVGSPIDSKFLLRAGAPYKAPDDPLDNFTRSVSL
eukprot:TRINITY_DN396_c1_g1_i1.p1 TRINITY_DN396_c1_g1~~TRINITY_DN396_c1_g1_i1.p1  ORF type:complete len:193 (+),score=44.40 TRINITY_DN396_c1_g1_i1:73-651(+)